MATFNLTIPKNPAAQIQRDSAALEPNTPHPKRPHETEPAEATISARQHHLPSPHAHQALQRSGAPMMIVRGSTGIVPEGTVTINSHDEPEESLPFIPPSVTSPDALLRALEQQALLAPRRAPGSASHNPAAPNSHGQGYNELERLLLHSATATSVQPLGYTPLAKPSVTQPATGTLPLTGVARNSIAALGLCLLLLLCTQVYYNSVTPKTQSIIGFDSLAQRLSLGGAPEDLSQSITTYSAVRRIGDISLSAVVTASNEGIDGLVFDLSSRASDPSSGVIRSISAENFEVFAAQHDSFEARGKAVVVIESAGARTELSIPALLRGSLVDSHGVIKLRIEIGEHSPSPDVLFLRVDNGVYDVGFIGELALRSPEE